MKGTGIVMVRGYAWRVDRSRRQGRQIALGRVFAAVALAFLLGLFVR